MSLECGALCVVVVVVVVVGTDVKLKSSATNWDSITQVR